jgi:hypothetical protein
VKALHARTEVRARGLDQEMKVISHDDVTQQIPPMADDELLGSVDQPASVRIIANDLLAGIPPRHHVIDRAFWAWAPGAVSKRTTAGGAERGRKSASR